MRKCSLRHQGKQRTQGRAWDFIECCIRHKSVNEYFLGLPARKEMLQELIALFMVRKYATDEDGNAVLDEAIGE